MIPYEELERALARWKVRHVGAVEAVEPVVEGESQSDGNKTPPGILVNAGYQGRDSTGELELTDAEVDEA